MDPGDKWNKSEKDNTWSYWYVESQKTRQDRKGHIDTENKLIIVRGESGRGLGKIGKGG